MSTVRLRVAAAWLGLALVGAGCGGASASPPASTLTPDVEVVALDIEFDQQVYTAAPGPVTIRYENAGSLVHTLVIEGIDNGFHLSVDAHGDLATATVDLAPGSYVIFCDVSGHRAAGMEARLDIG